MSSVTVLILDNPGREWIEVDLGRIKNVTGVVMQGALYSTVNEWVTGFKVEYGTVFGSRISVTENFRAKVQNIFVIFNYKITYGAFLCFRSSLQSTSIKQPK